MWPSMLLPQQNRPTQHAEMAQLHAGLPTPRPGRSLGMGQEFILPPRLKEARVPLTVHLIGRLSAHIGESKPQATASHPNPNFISLLPHFLTAARQQQWGSGGGHGGHRQRGQRPPDQV
jgi:hypothetical protein